MEKNIEQSESSNFEGTKHIDVAGLCLETIDFEISLSSDMQEKPQFIENFPEIKLIIQKTSNIFHDIEIHVQSLNKKDSVHFDSSQITKTFESILNILDHDFDTLLKNKSYLLEVFQKFDIESVKKKENQSYFEGDIGKLITRQFQTCDFVGLFWVFHQLIFQLLGFFLKKQSEFHPYKILHFEENLIIFEKILQLIEISAFISELHPFAFNYIFSKILGHLFTMLDFDFVSYAYEISTQRIINLHWFLVIPFQDLNLEHQIENIRMQVFKIFQKVKMGKSFYSFLKNVLFSNLHVFCQINYPFMEKEQFNEENIVETKKHLEEILDFLPNHLYSFSCGLAIDLAVTLSNTEIAISKKFFDNAMENYKNKYYLLMILYHEIGHLKGLYSYKGDNSFFISPERILFEAGNYAQISSFDSIYFYDNLKNDEQLYSETLIEVIKSQDENKIRKLLKAQNFIEKIENKSNISPFHPSHIGNNEKQPYCVYSSLLLTVRKGIRKLYGDGE